MNPQTTHSAIENAGDNAALTNENLTGNVQGLNHAADKDETGALKEPVKASL